MSKLIKNLNTVKNWSLNIDDYEYTFNNTDMTNIDKIFNLSSDYVITSISLQFDKKNNINDDTLSDTSSNDEISTDEELESLPETWKKNIFKPIPIEIIEPINEVNEDKEDEAGYKFRRCIMCQKMHTLDFFKMPVGKVNYVNPDHKCCYNCRVKSKLNRAKKLNKFREAGEIN